MLSYSFNILLFEIDDKINLSPLIGSAIGIFFFFFFFYITFWSDLCSMKKKDNESFLQDCNLLIQLLEIISSEDKKLIEVYSEIEAILRTSDGDNKAMIKTVSFKTYILKEFSYQRIMVILKEKKIIAKDIANFIKVLNLIDAIDFQLEEIRLELYQLRDNKTNEIRKHTDLINTIVGAHGIEIHNDLKNANHKSEWQKIIVFIESNRSLQEILQFADNFLLHNYHANSKETIQLIMSIKNSFSTIRIRYAELRKFHEFKADYFKDEIIPAFKKIDEKLMDVIGQLKK